MIVQIVRHGIRPVIELDRKTDGDDYTSFVDGDNEKIVEEAGQYAKELQLDCATSVPRVVMVPVKLITRKTPRQSMPRRNCDVAAPRWSMG